MDKSITYYIKSEKGFVPVSGLDNILANKDINIEYDFYSPYSGMKITDHKEFQRQAIKNIQENKYFSFDHLPPRATVDGINTVYISLDNSVRANSNNNPLSSRLGEILVVTNRIIKDVGDCLIFFSESCRPSFTGGDINNRKDEVLWSMIRDIIRNTCKLEYLGESKNNDDLMSFGVSAFCTRNYRELIDCCLPKRILTEGFGSGALGVKFTNGKIIWGIHFPLDFKNQGKDNLGHKAMIGLCDLMVEYPTSLFAIGDFNTIPGNIINSIKDAIHPKFEFKVPNDILTFYGAYYDVVVPREGEEWVELC